MRIDAINQVSSRLAGSGNSPAAKATESRALVTVTPPKEASTVSTNYRQAPFLAHLLAVKDQHAQTRERRRAEPGEAIAAYRTAASLIR
jgi:hypothetical protein